MILSDFFDQVNTAYRGSDDDAPAVGTTDYTLWLNTTNRKINEFATDPDIKWRSLFESNRSIGVVAVATQSYDLDDDFFAPSDQVIVTTGGQDTNYVVVPPQERGTILNTAYISGANPQVLTFYDAFTSSSSVLGGTITVPGYFIPADLTSASDTIPVDDPYWLVYAVAAELAFNDLTYESKTADLVAKANALWNKMIRNNRQGTSGNPRTIRTNVDRIYGSTR